MLTLIALAMMSGEHAAGPVASVQNLTVKTYPVSGRTVQEVRRSINAARPPDPSGLTKGLDVLSRWAIDFDWDEEQTSAGCRVVNVSTRFSAEMALPELQPPPTGRRMSAKEQKERERLEARWQEYIAALKANEAVYLAAAEAGRPKVEVAIATAACGKVREAGSKAIEAIGKAEAVARGSKERQLKIKF